MFSFHVLRTVEGLKPGRIGIPGTPGFGVGVYPGTLSSGFTGAPGYKDPLSDSYGNYLYNNESVMVFIPKFYYRIGSTSSPRYATYGANAIDIVGTDTFANQSAANAAGYSMPRAFIDGGNEKLGFFIDKFHCSKSSDGVSYGRSIQLGVPISLTTTTTFTRSAGMTNCVGNFSDAITLSRARGAGFNCISIFMYSCLGLLSLAHAQSVSSTEFCAWYDATNNFPKGSNNGNLQDVNDTSLTFISAGDAGYAFKPKCGSGSVFAKTTHNGQNNGVADVNGCMWDIGLGITYPGTDGVIETQVATGTAYQQAYVLKTSVALSSLTAGWNGATDAWQSSAKITTLYDNVTDIFWWQSGSTVLNGNGTTQVFSSATSGRDWLRTSSGIPATASGTSATGIKLFGNDAQLVYNRMNMTPVCGGSYSDSNNAGIFMRRWGLYRSIAAAGTGFRAGFYMS